jgi:hypothetical protein
MKTLKNKIAAITIATFFILSMTASTMLIPSANAHTPPWNIPEYAYIVAAPNPIGVGQTIEIYMWLDSVYGAAGGTTATVGTNGYTASAALLSNDYRFHNYEFTITSPNGTKTTTTFPVVSDPTSDQIYHFTPTAVGTYTLNFTFPGQVYGANGDGYSGSVLMGDYYLPASASTTLTVQQAPIPAAITSYPLPTAYWTYPIFAENTNWWSISSNWLGQGSPPPGGSSGGPSSSSTSTYQALYHNDAVGPQTSHVMWTEPFQFGGVVGGNFVFAGGSNPNGNVPGVTYYEGSSYDPRFANPIIINGYLYYTECASFTATGGNGHATDAATGPTVCVNLQTGQQIWSKPNIPALLFGYIYNVYDPDEHGVFPPILVAAVGGPGTGIPATWELFDAFTGDFLFNVTNVPSGTSVMGPSGEVLTYVLTNKGTPLNPQWYLAEWNMSKLWQYDINPYTGGGSLVPSIINATNGVLISYIPIPLTGETGTLPNGQSVFVPYGSALTVNANIPKDSYAYAPGTTTPIIDINQGSLTTYDWNISLGSYVNSLPATAPPVIVGADFNDIMLCRSGVLPTGFAGADIPSAQTPYTYFAVNLNSSKGAVGSILWHQTYNPPTGNLTVEQQPINYQTRVFTLGYDETMQFVGYSLDTGNLLWTTPSQATFDYYDSLIGTTAYGNLYSSSYAGICYCYNDLTGKIEWTWGNGPPGSDNSTYGGLQIFYGDYPTQIQSIANGVVYLITDEHTIPDPIYKGSEATALNATTGQLIWQLSAYGSEWSNTGAGTSYVVADGFAVFFNGLDNQIYSVGRGPSQTTVTAPDVGVTTATPVVIRGTVTDISAGTKQNEQAADFPNGVPCASDASMTAWMEYVYQQKPEPTNFTGVPVTISVTDSNGNHYTIGTATTDESGMFTLAWTPIIPGNYTVYATFAGTNGYWPSSAETSFNAGTPPATPAPTAAPPSGLASTGSLELGIAAVIIVIVIIGAVIILTLRRRP